MAAKRKVKGGMKVDVYAVLARAVDEGMQYGWNRAHKHTDKPSKEALLESLEREVMSSICEVFSFDP